MRTLTGILCVALALSLGLLIWIAAGTPGGWFRRHPPHVLPEIKTAGWLNGPAPSRESLKGKVVIIEAWATWCIPCREAAPLVAEIQRKYAPDGAVFISLTGETSAYLDEIKKYVHDTDIGWLTGYGASETLTELDVEGIPNAWVFGRDGREVWSGYPGYREEFENAIATALAEKVADRK